MIMLGYLIYWHRLTVTVSFQARYFKGIITTRKTTGPSPGHASSVKQAVPCSAHLILSKECRFALDFGGTYCITDGSEGLHVLKICCRDSRARIDYS